MKYFSLILSIPVFLIGSYGCSTPDYVTQYEQIDPILKEVEKSQTFDGLRKIVELCSKEDKQLACHALDIINEQFKKTKERESSQTQCLDEINSILQRKPLQTNLVCESECMLDNLDRISKEKVSPNITWHCLCYKERIRGKATKSTACRTTARQCRRLHTKISQGTSILVANSQSEYCYQVKGIHPSEGTQSPSKLWKASKKAKAWWSPKGCLLSSDLPRSVETQSFKDDLPKERTKNSSFIYQLSNSEKTLINQCRNHFVGDDLTFFDMLTSITQTYNSNKYTRFLSYLKNIKYTDFTRKDFKQFHQLYNQYIAYNKVFRLLNQSDNRNIVEQLNQIRPFLDPDRIRKIKHRIALNEEQAIEKMKSKIDQLDTSLHLSKIVYDIDDESNRQCIQLLKPIQYMCKYKELNDTCSDFEHLKFLCQRKAEEIIKQNNAVLIKDQLNELAKSVKNRACNAHESAQSAAHQICTSEFKVSCTDLENRMCNMLKNECLSVSYSIGWKCRTLKQCIHRIEPTLEKCIQEEKIRVQREYERQKALEEQRAYQERYGRVIAKCRCWKECFGNGGSVEGCARGCGADNAGIMFLACKGLRY